MVSVSDSLLRRIEEDAVTKVCILPLRERCLSFEVLSVVLHVAEVRLLSAVELSAGGAPVGTVRAILTQRSLLIRHTESRISLEFATRAHTVGIALVHAHQPVEPLLHLVNFMLLHLHLVVFEHVANLFTAPLVVTFRDNIALYHHFTDLAPITLRFVNTLD